MKKVLQMTWIVLLVCFFVAAGPARAADIKPVELKIWSAWIPDTFSTDPFMHMFNDLVNEKGKAVNLSVKFVGGPEVFAAFDGFDALRKGLVDMAYSAAVYHTGAVPEARAMNLSQLTPMEERESGAYDMMDKFHRDRAGVHYLFRLGLQPYFNFYMNIELDKVDFTGLKLRSTPAYDAIIKKLGGAIIRTEMSEVYTALERNMIQGYGFPTLGISDHKLEEVTKYVWGPAFNTSPTGVWVNLAKWNSLADEQRRVITEAGKQLEIDSTRIYPDYVTKDRELIGKAGVKVYKLSPENEKYLLKVVADASWEDTLQKAPEAAALRPLMSK
ncbi:MAG: TRAP transporter substrate-binding protein DctP [Deltaproteobacteria bacterium]|nr:TRAP transporter substrate-binding protein DctP [Deltaproteobacteria bacterium]